MGLAIPAEAVVVPVTRVAAAPVVPGAVPRPVISYVHIGIETVSGDFRPIDVVVGVAVLAMVVAGKGVGLILSQAARGRSRFAERACSSSLGTSG